jgi:NAD(P) transhydrogenase subunit alpha
MQIGIPKEVAPGETRVAVSPDTVKKMAARGLAVAIERGAGTESHFPDEEYAAAGARLVERAEAFASDVVFKVVKPGRDEIGLLRPGAVTISYLDMCHDDGTWQALAEAGVYALALELMPRISRAQSMDVLSSQAGIAGYRAALEATRLYARFFPMMMTSAGSAKPARVTVLGAGVAGLQAIATARRLGAQVWAYDVRPEVKEQVQSLGAKFIELNVGEDGAGYGGYAKALSAEAQAREQQLLAEELKKADILISTAQIPCMPAPRLITEEAVRGMRPGSVIIDMSAASGGNCALTELDQTVIKHGVILCGISNYPALMPTDASNFYSRNLMNLLFHILDLGEGKIDMPRALEDEIVGSTLICLDGRLRWDSSPLLKNRKKP